MTLPNGIQTCRVTFGKRFNLAGVTRSLSGTFELDQDLLWAATGDVLEKGATPATFNSTTGMLEFDFPTSDQPGFEDGQGNSVTNFRGILRASVNGSPLPPIPFQVFATDVPGPVDLDFFVPANLRPGASVDTTYVRSVAGLSGPVTAAQLNAAGVGGGGARSSTVISDEDSQITLSRAGDVVIASISIDSGSGVSVFAAAIPTGYRPTAATSGVVIDTSGAVRVNADDPAAGGQITFLTPVTAALGSLAWVTDDPSPL